MTQWSMQQEAALKSVRDWLRDPGAPQVFRLFGYAGTGKTTLAKEIARSAKRQTIFAAFTGKAAHVLQTKGCDNASTIHSLIYKPEDAIDGGVEFVMNPDSPIMDADLVIIDEVSMVGEDLARDLLSFKKKILVLGDPAQLPPVSGEGFFTNAKPDVMLSDVHRQAEGSPIIQLATAIRKGGKIELRNDPDCLVIARNSIGKETLRDLVLSHDQVIVGRNQTRHAYNDRIRALKGIKSATPINDDKLVCLKNNTRKNLLNGSLWRVSGIPAKHTAKDKAQGISKLWVTPEEGSGRATMIRVRPEFWTGDEGSLSFKVRRGSDEFAFGYALTCHKCQGSQWDSVIVFDEAAFMREDAWRWRYTAVTRAAKKLTVVI